METKIRLLTIDDLPFLKAMQTGIEDDYVIRVYERMVMPPNTLYGLFVGDKLAALCGYTIFAGRYAMIGRLRSDERFRGKNFATVLTEFIKTEAFQRDELLWVGANTQEENIPARRVLEKQAFAEGPRLYGAVAEDVRSLCEAAPMWTKIDSLERKKDWLEQLYVSTQRVFPLECYYNFPATTELFSDELIAAWDFYENASRDRMFIAKRDYKKYFNWHIVYPWDDFMEQSGFWETVQAAYEQQDAPPEYEKRIWFDFDEAQVASLPSEHPFELPSPWILYGAFRPSMQKELPVRFGRFA